MRKPRCGEKPSGFAEEQLKKAGIVKWKLEPHDIKILRDALTKTLEERSAYWAKKFSEQKRARED